MGTYYSNQLLAFTNMEDTARDEKVLFCEVHSQILSPNCLILNESIPTRSMTAFVLILIKEDKKTLMAENAGSTNNKERNKCKPRCILQPEDAVIINTTHLR